MTERSYPDSALLRAPQRWHVLPKEAGLETARLRLDDQEMPWPVLLVRPGQPLADDNAFAFLSLVDQEGEDMPTGLSRLRPLASGTMPPLPAGEAGVEAMRAALAASAEAPAQARLAAGQALAEAAAAALPDGTEWCLYGARIRSPDGLRPLARLPIPPDLFDGVFVWSDPSEDDGLWLLPWRGAALGGIRGRAGAATAHRRADLVARADALLSGILGPAEARRILDAL